MVPVRDILREFGMTEQQWRALRTVSDRGPLDASSVAAAALLRPPSLTRILGELIDRGLIARTSDLQDGRRSIVEITPAGRALVRRILSHTVQLTDRWAMAFGPERLKTLMAELELLTEKIRDVTAAEMKISKAPSTKNER
jgi:DNA-binding MarR family transcriptional regulator